MAHSIKATKILSFAYNNEGKITKKQAVDLLENSYYCNASKHVGDILSRLVNSGKLIRIKPGIFKLGKAVPQKPNTIDNPAQLSFF